MKALKYLLGFSMPLLLLVASCTEKKNGEDNGSEYNRSELLVNYSTNLILPAYAELNGVMNQLKTVVNDFTASPNLANLVLLRETLLRAQIDYQYCSSFEFGPASANTLRSVLSTYPTSESVIESNIINGNYDLHSIGNIAAKGFPALDYLVFGSQKTDQEIIDSFTMGVNSTQRKDYLVAVVNQSSNVISQVYKAWQTEGYQSVFENADGKAVGSSVSLMLNSMVLDFERYIRDGKVGIPLGVRSLGVENPEKVEAYYSVNSLELVIQSITAYKNVFNGIGENRTDGPGFDDYLNHEGATETTSKINAQLDAVLAKLNNLSGPLSRDVVVNKNQVQEVYDEMQKTIVLLKVEMPSALSVLITYQDSDGD